MVRFCSSSLFFRFAQITRFANKVKTRAKWNEIRNSFNEKRRNRPKNDGGRRVSLSLCQIVVEKKEHRFKEHEYNIHWWLVFFCFCFLMQRLLLFIIFFSCSSAEWLVVAHRAFLRTYSTPFPRVSCVSVGFKANLLMFLLQCRLHRAIVRFVRFQIKLNYKIHSIVRNA